MGEPASPLGFGLVWNEFLQCVYLTVPMLGPGHVLDDVTLMSKFWPTRYEYFGAVGVHTSSSPVKVGAHLTVRGAAWPRWGVLRLQQLVGRTWKTLVAKPISRDTGRATFAWHGTRPGPALLRVLASGSTSTSLAPTPSRTVRVVVVR